MIEFYDGFDSKEDVLGQFGGPDKALDGADLILAYYQYEDYSGYAHVVYRIGEQLFQVNGSHCSCNGLEDQWEPEPTTWEELAQYVREGTFGAAQELRDLIDLHVPPAAEPSRS